MAQESYESRSLLTHSDTVAFTNELETVYPTESLNHGLVGALGRSAAQHLFGERYDPRLPSLKIRSTEAEVNEQDSSGGAHTFEQLQARDIIRQTVYAMNGSVILVIDKNFLLAPQIANEALSNSSGGLYLIRSQTQNNEVLIIEFPKL